ncbi:MAG: hypothetical protein JNL01_04255 [Bdellovibrionales bacterium]|nr:hypothetical protein [Bdellovibrionales bacterium]
MGTGKSTLGLEISKLTGVPNIPMDRVRWYYYLKDGYSMQSEAALKDDFPETMKYWKPFEVRAVKRIIQEFPNAIIDFGAGHSYFVDPMQFDEVQATLSEIPGVVLVLPSPDRAESLQICNERLLERRKKPLEKIEIEANRAFIEHESNRKLAKQTVYTHGKTVRQTAEEILNLF